MRRWEVTVRYRSEGPAGTVDVPHEIEELIELHDLIERGPNWYAIERIEITLADKALATTLEASERE